MNPLWYLNLYKKTYILFFPNTLVRFSSSIVLLFFKPETDYQYIYYLISFNFFFNAIFGYWHIFKNYSSKFNLSDIKIIKLISNSYSYFLASIINHNITSLWSVYVSIFFSNSSIGFLSFVNKFIEACV